MPNFGAKIRKKLIIHAKLQHFCANCRLLFLRVISYLTFQRECIEIIVDLCCHSKVQASLSSMYFLSIVGYFFPLIFRVPTVNYFLRAIIYSYPDCQVLAFALLRKSHKSDHHLFFPLC